MKNFYRLLVAAAIITLTDFSVNAQNVGIGTATPAQKLEIAGMANTIRINGLRNGGNFNVAATTSSNILYVNNTNGDIYSLPAGTNGSILAISATGVPTWSTSATSSTAWQLTGNSGTTAGTNFIGTTDATDLVFKTGLGGGIERMRIGGTALDAGYVGINAPIVTTQQLTVSTSILGNIGIAGSNTFAVAAGSGNGAAGVVGLGNGGVVVFKDSSALYMDAGVYGSSGAGSYVRSTGAGFIGVGVLGLSGSTFPNSQPLPPAAGVVGASNAGGVGVVGMTSKGGTGVFATTASTNGQAAPLPVSGYGVFAVGSSKSEGAVYGFIGNGEDQFPLTTAPAVNASIYGTTNLTGNNSTTLLNNWAIAAINNNSITAPTGNGLLVYGTTNEIGTVTLGQNGTTYMTGGVAANGSLQFDNANNAFTAIINANPAATASYTLTLPSAQGAASTVLTNDGAGNLSWTAAGGSSVLSNGTGINTLNYNGTSSASVSIANTGVTAGTYGSDTTVPVYNVNAQGQITSVSNVRISSGALTGTAGGDLSGTYPDPTVIGLQGQPISSTTPSTNQVLIYDGSEWAPGNPSGAGTVTSVGLSLPANVFNITGSPVTGAGTLTGTLANQNANVVFAGPVSGGAGAPTFRALVAADVPVGSGNYIQNQNSVAQTANFYITGNASIGTAPVTGQQLTVATTGAGSTTPAAVVGSNSLVVAAGSGNGAAGIVGLGNGGTITFKDSSALYMDIGVYGSSGNGSYVRNTGAGYIGIGVFGLSGTAIANSQPLPSGAGVVGMSDVATGGVGVVGMTSKGGTGVFATTASTNGQAAPLPVSGYGVFAVGSSKSEGAVYGFIGNGEDQFPLTTAPAVNASIYGTTNLTGNNTTTLLNNWAVAAINNNSITAPTGNGLLVYGTTNEVGTVTLGQNGTTYMTGGTAANGQLVFDNASNTNTVTINTGITSGSYALNLPTSQGAASTVLTNDGAGNLSWALAGSGAALTNGTGIGTFTYNGSSAATVALANTGVTANTYGDANDFTTFTVNAQGQLMAVGTQPLPTTLPPSGAAGGDLSGTYPTPTINELQGIGVLASGANVPTTGNILAFNGTQWSPTTGGTAGQVLQYNGTGVPTWGTPSTSATAWQLTGNSETTAGTNFIGTTDATDLVFKTGLGGGIERMRIGGTALDAGYIGINTAPVGGTNPQQLTVGSSAIGNTAIVGTNTATYNASSNGIIGVAGLATGGAIIYTVNTGGPFAQSVNAGVFGSAGRGNGTNTLGFGTVGLLGNSMPNSAAFPPGGAGVLGATKTGGTAPFAAGVAGFASGGGYAFYGSSTGGGYGVYNTATGGGIGYYTAVTGSSSLIAGTSGNFGVYVLGNKNSVSGVYSYMGSKGVATVPTVVSAVYATTDSTLGNVWALVANNTKSTTAPTGNGLLVYGTTNEIGTVTLGQNTTSYMTGGTAANGSLVFDNSTNTNTVTINTGVTSGSYSLTLPAAQGAASAVLTNDGAGNLSWATAGSSSLSNLTNGTGISAFTYNGSSAATVALANTGVTANTYGDANDFTTFTVNAQGQLTAAGTQPLPATLPPSGAAGGDLSNNYPNPTVSAINGVGLGSTTATAGNLLIASGSQWVSTAVSGDVSISNIGVITIGANAVNYGKMQQASAGTLLGNPTGATANVSEITLGTGLSFSGTTLIATGTGGSLTSVGLSVPGSSIFGVTGTPVTSTGTLGLTTTGTSGGIPYFSSGSALSSSAALTHYGIVYGGGAGGAPVTTAALTNGQVLVGSTGLAPVPAILTQASNSGISITNGAGNITIGTNGVLDTIATITNANAASSTNGASFSTTYTPHVGTNVVQVELIGAGGGGGGSSGPSSKNSSGGGGGSGGYIKFFVRATPSTTFNVTVGTAGAGGIVGSNNGINGGATTIVVGGTTYSAGGGAGGVGGSAGTIGTGGAGGTNSGGTPPVTMPGTVGGAGLQTGVATPVFAIGGAGASSILGGGAVGIELVAAGVNNGTNAATNSGSGGSGGVDAANGTGASGGNGANGIIIITEYR